MTPDIRIVHEGNNIWAIPLTVGGNAYCRRYKGVTMAKFLITSETPDDMLRFGLVIEYTP